MKTGEDFRREFPEMEADFAAAAQNAINRLPEKRSAVWPYRTAILAAVMVIIAVSALPQI